MSFSLFSSDVPLPSNVCRYSALFCQNRLSISITIFPLLCVRLSHFKWNHNIRCIYSTTIHLYHMICIPFAFSCFSCCCRCCMWLPRLMIFACLHEFVWFQHCFFPHCLIQFIFNFLFSSKKSGVKSNTFQIGITRNPFSFWLVCFLMSSSSLLSYCCCWLLKASSLSKSHVFNGYLCICWYQSGSCNFYYFFLPLQFPISCTASIWLSFIHPNHVHMHIIMT